VGDTEGAFDNEMLYSVSLGTARSSSYVISGHILLGPCVKRIHSRSRSSFVLQLFDVHMYMRWQQKEKNFLQSDHKKTPQLISFLFEIRFQQAVHQIKGFKEYYKLDIKCCP
jgi:hypothetical protein